jgi:hypothetical protein
MFLIGIKAPHFVHFNADSDVFMGFQILYLFFFLFNSFITVSVLTPHSRAVARIPAPSTAHLIRSEGVHTQEPAHRFAGELCNPLGCLGVIKV